MSNKGATKTVDILVPEAALKYILFQRTRYLRIWPIVKKIPFVKLIDTISPSSGSKAIVWLESRFRQRAIRDLFNRDMLDEFESVKGFLPARVSTIFDIGCGVGAINVLFHRHYSYVPDINFYPLDKIHIDEKIYYRFTNKAAYYNSLDITRMLLSKNGIPTKNIHPIEVAPDYRIDIKTDIDLIVSFLSWGFHYPVSVYLDQAYNLLKQGGRLIIDVRRKTDGEQQLAEKFGNIHRICEHRKSIRVLAIK